MIDFILIKMINKCNKNQQIIVYIVMNDIN